jgi:1-acyl-sn-glycerol-3-phosphate acyltransferase
LQQTSYFTRIFRIVCIVIHIFAGIAITALVLPFANKEMRLAITRWWCKRLLKCFNIKVITYGKLPDASTVSTMFVGNHISWMDIHSINSIIPLRFIAKIEVESWPVFGYLVSKSGTLFINRSIRKDATRIIDITTDSLLEGDNVCLFPEGTTTDGSHMLPFKSSIVQAAINANANIWPVAIYYPMANGEPNTHMAYAGETTMAESMSRILNQKNPIVQLHFLTPISCQGHNRQSATKAAFEAITAKLQPLANPSHRN